MNVLSYVLSWCKCEDKIEYDPETIEVLRAIYRETLSESEDTEYEETDSEDSDYEPTSDVDDDYSTSESESDSDDESVVGEELIVKQDIKKDLFWLF